MIERGLLHQDSEQPGPQGPDPGADQTAMDTAEEGSKLNRLLQTPTINKINYMENYKLLCPSGSGMSITSSGPPVGKAASATISHKSVIQKGPNSMKREPPSATITSGASGQQQQQAGGTDNSGTTTTLVIINTSTLGGGEAAGRRRAVQE